MDNFMKVNSYAINPSNLLVTLTKSQFDWQTLPGRGGGGSGVTPHMGYIAMCRGIGYGF